MRIDRSGSGFSLDAGESRSVCWEIDFRRPQESVHRGAEGAEGGDTHTHADFAVSSEACVLFSHEREAAATNDELNTAAVAVGAQI